MVVEKNINWYLDDPNRLLKMKPFYRGGSGVNYITEHSEISPNTLVDVSDTNSSVMMLDAISQEVYLSEYNPYSHTVNDMVNMPVVTITFKNDRQMTINKVPTSSAYQKVIHATQIQNLTHAGTNFLLCNPKKQVTQELEDLLVDLENLWAYECEEATKADIFSCAKNSGDVGVLFEGKEFGYNRRILQFKDGYRQITNYDEYGREVATTEYYVILDGKVERIDTYTNDKVYRFIKDNRINEDTKESTDKEWRKIEESFGKSHGYSSNPLLQKRDVVAWEYVQHQITMYEILDNALALCQKNYTTFMMVAYGDDIEPNAFDTGSSGIKSIKISDMENGKVEFLQFPDNSNVYKYMEHLKEQIETFSFTTLGNSSKTQTSGSDSRGGAMTMRYKADLALAVMTLKNWSKFWQKYIKLFCEAMDFKYNEGEKIFRKLMLKMDNKAWTPISESLMLDNIILAYQAGILSLQTATELCPVAKRGELNRILKEQEDKLKAEKELALAQSANPNPTEQIVVQEQKTIE